MRMFFIVVLFLWFFGCDAPDTFTSTPLLEDNGATWVFTQYDNNGKIIQEYRSRCRGKKNGNFIHIFLDNGKDVYLSGTIKIERQRRR